MKNKKFVLFFKIFLSIGILSLSVHLDSEECSANTGEIVEIEKDKVYMVPLGAQDGANEGEAVEVSRDGDKIAQLILISVLGDSSMARVVNLFESGGILPTDLAELSGIDLSKEKKEFFVSEELVLPKVTTYKAEDSGVTAASLGKQLRKTEALFASLEQDKSRLEKQLDQREIEIAALREELKSTKVSYEDKIKSTKESLEEKVSSLTSKLRESEVKVGLLDKQLQDEVKKLEKELEIVTSQKDDTEKKLGASIARLESMVATLSAEKSELLRETTQNKEELTKLKKSSSQLEESLSVRDVKLVNLEDETYMLKEELLVKEQKWQEREDDLKRDYLEVLDRQKSGAQKKLTFEKEQLRKQIDSLNDQLNNLKKTSDEKISSLENKLDEKESEITNLTREKLDLANTLGKRDNEIASLEDSLSKVKDELYVTKASIPDTVKVEKKPLEEKIDKLTAELTSLDRSSEDKIEILNAELDSAKKDYQEKIAALEKRAKDDITSEAKYWQDRLDTAKNNSDQELKQQKEYYEAEFAYEQTKSQDKIDSLGREITQLRRESNEELTAIKAKIKEKESEISSLSQDKADLQLKLTQKEREAADSKVKVLTLNEDISILKNSIPEKIKSVEEPLKKEIEKLKSDLVYANEDFQEKMRVLQEQTKVDAQVRYKEWEAKNEALKQEYEDKLTKQEEQYLSQVDSLSNQLKQLKNTTSAEISELKDQIKKEQTAISDLNKEKSKLEKGLEKANKSITDSEDLAYRTRKDFQDLKSKFNQKVKTAKEPLEETIETLNSQLVSLKKKSEDDLMQLEKRWQDLLDAKQVEFDSELAEQLDMAKVKISENENRLLEKIGDLEEEFDQAKASYLKEIDALNARIREEQADKVAFKERSAELTDKLSQKEREISYLDKNIASLEEELALLKQSSSESLDTLQKEYEAKLIQQKQEADENLAFSQKRDKEKISTLERQIVQLEGATSSKTDKLELQIRENEAVISSLNKDKAKLIEDFRERDNEISGFKVQIAELKEDMAKSSQEWQKKLSIAISKESDDKELIQLTSTINEKDHRISSLTKENDALKNYLNQRDDELDGLKDTVASLRQELAQTGISGSQVSTYDNKFTSEQKAWYNENEDFERYYLTIREKIFDKLKKVDFSAYKGKVSYVKVEFELYPSGILKDSPRFYGTRDNRLKSLLNKCFQQALPFPEFPKSLNKSSQRFIIAISFE